MPTPLPPKMQLSHMPASGVMPASGLRLSCEQLTEPQAMRGGRGGERSTGRSAESQLLAFQVAQRLIDGQGGRDGGFRLVGAVLPGSRSTPPRSAAGMETTHLCRIASVAGDFLGVYLVCLRRQAGLGCSVSQLDGPHRSMPTSMRHHHAENRPRRDASGSTCGRTSAPARTGTGRSS